MANRLDDLLKNKQNIIVAAMAVMVVIMLILPLPKAFIDFFMVVNIFVSVLILLLVLFTPKASDFSSFPRVILFATIFGLALNVSSTRLILSSGGNLNSQSEMVKAFSSVVTGGSADDSGLVVGFVIFIILIVIQAIVITKGATRVSEVAARFSLDAMPQKMFAVDSEFNSGAITEEEARARKRAVQKESDFYSAMDGSSKFVSGNVKAGIFITAVNLIAGVITGMALRHEPLGSVFGTYTRLTIGDGLLSQLPSLLLSFATGVLVTGSNSEEPLGEQLERQFNIDGWTYIIAGALLAVMGIIPGFPKLILFPVAALVIFYGYRMIQGKKRAAEKKAIDEAAERAKPKSSSPVDVAGNLAPLDPISIELGYALIPLVDHEKGAELLNRVTHIRKETALDLGLVVPKIRIVDNVNIDPNEYNFKIKGIEAGHSSIKIGYYMAMNVNGVTKELSGERTQDPTFGMPAIWIPEDRRQEAEEAGYVLVDPPTIIATHLTQMIRANAAEILDLQSVSVLVNNLRETNPVVVDEVMGNGKFTYLDIQSVLKNLLQEEVSIRNLSEILETMAQFAPVTHNVWFLSEKVRERLGSQICAQYVDQDRVMRVVTVSQPLAQSILEHRFEPSDGSRPYVAFSPDEGRKWITAVSDQMAAMKSRNMIPIIMCPAEIRQLVKGATEREMPGIVVLSVSEIAAAGTAVKVEIVGEIRND